MNPIRTFLLHFFFTKKALLHFLQLGNVVISLFGPLLMGTSAILALIKGTNKDREEKYR